MISWHLAYPVRQFVNCVSVASVLAWATHAQAQPAEPAPPAAPPPTTTEPATQPAPSPVQTAPIAPATAPVQPPVQVAPSVPPTSAELTAEEPEKKKKKKNKKPKNKLRNRAFMGETAFGTLALKGRVFTRAEYQRQERSIVNRQGIPEDTTVNSLDLSVNSARIGVLYQSSLEWLSGEIDVEVTGRPDLRDGYLQAKGRHLMARAGRFRMPVSAIEMTSRWDLPTADRGFIHRLLVDWLDIDGRRPGVMFGVRGRGGLRPKLVVGAFQGSVLVDQSLGQRETNLIAEEKMGAQSLVTRAEIRLFGVDFGAFYEHRVGSPRTLETEYYWTAGADAVLDRRFATGGFRLWMDFHSGASWYEHEDKSVDNDDATFVAARAIPAYRFGGTELSEFYVEPYAQLGILDPDLDVTADFAWETALGVNVGFWDRARLTLQGTINEGDRNFPDAYLAGREPDRISVVLQAGAVF